MKDSKLKITPDKKTRVVLLELLNENRQMIIDKQKHGRAYVHFIDKSKEENSQDKNQQGEKDLERQVNSISPISAKSSKNLTKYLEDLDNDQISIEEAIEKAKTIKDEKPNYIEKVLLKVLEIKLELVKRNNRRQCYLIEQSKAREEKRNIKDLTDGNMQNIKLITSRFNLEDETNTNRN